MQTLNTLENILIVKPVAKPKDPYRMGGRKELDALFEQANKDLADGKCKEVKQEDLKKFLGLE